MIRRQPKRGVAALFKLPRIKKRYARFLCEQAQGAIAARYVIGSEASTERPLLAGLAPVGNAR